MVSPDQIEVFVICPVGAVERGGAKAFSLSRLTEAGEQKPFPIFIVRSDADDYVGYVNACPHQGVWLNIGAGEFFTRDRVFIRCGRHGACFEIDTGLCIDGPCLGKSLEPIALAVIDGDICLCGVSLVEEDRLRDPFDDLDETMEVVIHPD